MSVFCTVSHYFICRMNDIMFANTKQQLLPGGDATASCRPERNMVVVYLGNTAVFTTVTVKKIAALPPG